MIINICHRIPDSYACETRAGLERVSSDARHGIRNRHARQSRTTNKRKLADARHMKSGSVVGDGFRDNHVTSIFVGVL